MTAFLVKGWGANGTMLDQTPPEHPAIKYPVVSHKSNDTRPLVWGGIASSAVTHAQISFPEYFEAIRQAAPEKCILTLERAVEAIDAGLEVAGGRFKGAVKGLFGLEGLKSDADFAEVSSCSRSHFGAEECTIGHLICARQLASTQLGSGG